MKRLVVVGFWAVSSAQALTVFAASSLTDAFGELGRVYAAQTGERVRFQFAGSQVLATQLGQGARADLVASASSVQLRPLASAGRVGKAVAFSDNHLTVIVPKDSALRQVADLGKAGVKVVVADRAVPAGSYTETLWQQAARLPAFGPRWVAAVRGNVVSRELNVRQVALKVALGEADAGVVYRSNLTPALRDKVRQLALPAGLQVRATYVIAPLTNSPKPQQARRFIQLLRSAQGQAILKKWGFTPILSVSRLTSAP